MSSLAELEARLQETEKRIAAVQAQAVERAALEARWALVDRVHDRLRTYINSLTAEERRAIDGVYLHLHGGLVDIVRQLPENPDKEGHGFLAALEKHEESQAK